ncbi:Hercynylcysteine sulfoxide lyase [Lachnellula suecica]|uniref:Hercynylcysteine sulfoxide lyase n=1 Tax=Lachnellula suecica TaxID=602035 RepID=A0A8T9C0Z1_9HELO|nr:Hercynylcysteine sulfoxide lyase [Lachnellula suecica]
MSSSEPTPFGREMRKKHFLFSPALTPLNHGGYGAFPATVRTAQRHFQDEQESWPDLWFQRSRRQHIDVSRRAIAKLVHADVEDCVFVTNTSTGLDIVLRNLEFGAGDVVVTFATTYYAVQNTLLSVMEMSPVQMRKVEYTFPIAHDEIVQKFLEVVRKAKNEGLNVRAAVVDTIVSVPGVRFPFEKLVKACKDEGILSIVDGAHGVGQISLDLGQLDPDFFLTNCHKWLYTPRGCALFYVPKRNQYLIQTPLPTGVGYVSTSKRGQTHSEFRSLFDFVATSDDTAWMCLPAALKFRDEACGGEEAIYTYLQKIAREGGDKIAEILGTEVMQEPGLEDSELRRCAMVNVRLPLGFKNGTVNTNVLDPSTSPYSLLEVEDAGRVEAWLKYKLMIEFHTMLVGCG